MARATSLLLLAGLALAAPAGAQTVGVNAAVVNDVRMTTDANRAVHRAVVKERVSLGNDILTGKASRLQVLLLDKTVFTVGASARIKVDRFVYDPARKASSVGLSVTRGAFRFMSGKPTKANPGQSNIRTPVASVGIRGTIVEGVVGEGALQVFAEQTNIPRDVIVDPETASVFVLRGPGPEAEAGETPGAIEITSGGQTVVLDKPGMAAFVPGPGQPPIVFKLWMCGVSIFADLLRSPADALGQMTGPGPNSAVTDRSGRFWDVTRYHLVPR
jgi:hypothetical protein